MAKPSAAEIKEMLKQGNLRFCQGKAEYPHTGPVRVAQSGRDSQADHALVTILSCSDSQAPPELIFDLGVMDLFVVRVVGNVMNDDEIGSLEYGLCHVKTPLLVIMGHTRCEAVTAVTEAVLGQAHKLERHIPGLMAAITPAVHKAMRDNEKLTDKAAIVERACQENIWSGLYNLFIKSAAVRELAEAGQIAVAPAVYDVATGQVKWLDEHLVASILTKAIADPGKDTRTFA